MLLVGLTGGIGSGKSTVARLLAERGAVVIEADRLARDAVEPGSEGLRRVVELFGPGVVTSQGELDRAALGAIVFADANRRRALEEIVHPEVARRFADAVERHRDSDRVVVYAVPLVVELGLASAFDVVVAVTAPEADRIARIVADRGTTEREVLDRIAAQVSDEERAAVADLIVANDGTLEELARRVDELWLELQAWPSNR